jgi:hypothetical protein
MRRLPEILFVLAAVMVVAASPGRGAELYVGVAEANITHAQPMALWGQMHTRISKSVESPVTAQVVAIESREGDHPLDSAIMVSADIIGLPRGVFDALRKRVAERLPGFDVQKLFVNGTHTHTGPVFQEGDYKIPKEGVVQPTEYAQFFVDRVSEAAAKAWQDRKPGAVAWGLGNAVVGQNRRAVYADGRAVMYGRTDQPDFRGIEGYEDHTVEVLFFFDRQKKLLAAAINLACTAQEVESRSTVNADFLHEVREALREKHGRDLKVLGWIAAAGDQSPHLMFRQHAEDRMRELRGLTRLQEIARRIVSAFDEAYDGAKKEIHNDAVLAHRVARLDLPVRMVTDEEAAAAKAKVESLSKDPNSQTLVGWHQGIVDRHANQKNHPTHEVEIHVLRLGDVAITTNPFELFLDFGVQIKARSPALQTFVVQLVGVEGYLPTARAVRGGGYSAITESNTVGPEGGQVLTDRTVDLVKSLWPESNR